MCQYCDCAFPDIRRLRLDRRSLPRNAAVAAIAVGLPMAAVRGTRAAEAVTFKGTHGTGFCNGAFFVAHAMQFAKQDGMTLEFINTPTFAEQVTFFGSGQGDVSVLPCTKLSCSLRRRCAGEDRRRWQHPGLHGDRAARTRHACKAEGQDARRIPTRYAGGAAVRMSTSVSRRAVSVRWPASRSRVTYSPASDWRKHSASAQTICRAACVSAWRLPGHWQCSRECS